MSLISKQLTFLENAAAEDELYDSVADLLLTIINRTQLSINLSNVTFGKCVLERAGAKKSLLATVITRKLRYLITTVMRKSGDCVEEETAQSTLPERNKKSKTQEILEWKYNSMDHDQARTTDAASGGASRVETECGQPSDRGRLKTRQDKTVALPTAYVHQGGNKVGDKNPGVFRAFPEP